MYFHSYHPSLDSLLNLFPRTKHKRLLNAQKRRLHSLKMDLGSASEFFLHQSLFKYLLPEIILDQEVSLNQCYWTAVLFFI